MKTAPELVIAIIGAATIVGISIGFAGSVIGVGLKAIADAIRKASER